VGAQFFEFSRSSCLRTFSQRTQQFWVVKERTCLLYFLFTFVSFFMDRDSAIKSLKDNFPDMTQSVIGDVLGIYKGDAKAAAAALGGIDTETKKENDKKIKELQGLFPSASEQMCKEVLNSTNWDVEAAIAPLFTKCDEQKHKTRKEKKAKAIKKREAETKKQYEHLLEIFHTFSKEEIQKLLDENEGDIEETTNQLLELVKKQEEEKTKKKEANVKAEEKRMQEEQEFRLRELKIQALEEKFEDLSEKEVISALENARWDIKKAHLALMQASMDVKKKYLKSLFPVSALCLLYSNHNVERTRRPD
jgi:hypothetical protein